jgi:superfamily II DNA or RNA helicase
MIDSGLGSRWQPLITAGRGNTVHLLEWQFTVPNLILNRNLNRAIRIQIKIRNTQNKVNTTTQLSDALLAKLAGWDAVKQARSLVTADRVLASDWQPPTLKGTVQEGSATYRAGLVIRSESDADNLCTCRLSRQRGLICAHSVAVGLHFIKRQSKTVAPVATERTDSAPPPRKTKALARAAAGEKGEPLELWLILPPNLASALEKAKVMLYVEGDWREGRKPLNALPMDIPFTLSEQDGPLLDMLEKLNEGDTPAMMVIEAGQFAEILPGLAGHPRVTLGRTQPVEIAAEPLRVTVRASLESNGEIVLSLSGGDRQKLMRGGGGWTFDNRKLQRLGLPAGLDKLFDSPLRLARAEVPAFLNAQWPRLLASCEVDANFSLDDFVLETARPEFKLHLAGGLAVLEGRLDCFYGGKSVQSMPPDALWLADPQSPTHFAARDFGAEQEALARLVRGGFMGPDRQGLFHLKGQEAVLNFFARHYPSLEKAWKVTLEERLEISTRKLERVEPHFQITPSGEQWFDLQVTFDTAGGERFSTAEIQRLLRSGQSHTWLNNGKFALLDTGAVEELEQVLVDAAPEQHAGGYRLHNAQAGFLDATLRQQSDWRVQAPASWTGRAAQQRGEVKLQPPPLGALEPVLRSYQKEGVAWLRFLRANGFGGILADEMGLGKTLQVLAHLDVLKKTNDRPDPAPWLIVCPASLVFNWEAEARKFTPDLRVLSLHGPERHEKFAQIPGHDLIITSYSLLRRDAEQYGGIEFDTIVLDEAQHIKNRQTQNAQAVKATRARHRLVLTGTPLENSVLDLWSIFDFLMPGYLGSAGDFRERYEVAIARDKNSAAQERLARRVRPFMLRRLKRDVAAELPEKLEQISYCELAEDQRALYQGVLEAGRREMHQAAGAGGQARSRMMVLTALLRLRQICCDPRLLKLEGAGAPPASGKTELFLELLEEALDGGHRVLVFSQFASMLDLLREELAAQQIAFCHLDGATRNRAQVVEKFQSDPAIPVFLISLKAGGVGLNLTGADTVVHFDPWWNPAVEAQATDRAHRIGQKKVVTSYKLITRGTVEEKILNLQNRKRALTDAMLGDEEQLLQSLSWEEIQELLED